MIDLKEIRAGLSNEEFFLEYLPFISLADGRCTGAEALLRWRRNGMAPAGVRIALDDVMPVGFNLVVLSRGNFDMVKLDRQMIREIDPGKPAPKWLPAVTALVQSEHMQVMAEGIETEWQRSVLRDAGVTEGQGFYFSHPLPAGPFIDYHARAARA